MIYPTYPYNSQQAKDFRSAFAAARAAGLKEFTWEGRPYHTRTRDEETQACTPSS